MSETRKSLYFAAAFVAAAASVYAGLVSRERIDALPLPGDRMPTDSLMASKQAEPEFSEGRFFRDIVKLLKEEYVEPIDDDQKLAEGAVRGMVSSLGDPRSVFMEKDEFEAFAKAARGEYEGIGAELFLLVDQSRQKSEGSPAEPGVAPESREVQPLTEPMVLPRLVVAAVTPGGPADKAGVRPGDWVEAVDGHWVINDREVNLFRQALREFQQGKRKPDEMKSIRRRIRLLTDSSMLPLRAKSRLTLGTEGRVKVVWNRGEQSLTTVIDKGRSTLPMSGLQQDGTFRMAFEPGSAAKLRRAAQGKAELTIDLRNSVHGDYAELLEALAAVAPSGEYGFIQTEREKRPTVLQVDEGASSPPKITLLSDRTTRRIAEIFALALSHKGIARLSGQTGGDPAVVQTKLIPTGGGYTLVVGEYSPTPRPMRKSVRRPNADTLALRRGRMDV